ncbi:MAG: DUF4440 domain-containing protein [Acidimicrobiia bacterium]
MPGADEDERAVIEAEASLLRPEVRADPGALRELLHPDFFEIGVTRCADRQDVLKRLPSETRSEIGEIRDLRCVRLGQDLLLLTYVVAIDQRLCLRSSIWVRTDTVWRIRFHQGTPVVDHLG